VFLVGVTDEQVEPLKQLIAAQEGVEGPAQLSGSVAARLITIDGVPVTERLPRGTGRRFVNTLSVTSETQIPQEIRVLQGSWWKADEAKNLVSIADEVAKLLDIHLGSDIEIEATGQTIHARVAALHDVVAIRNAPNGFIFTPPSLAGLPVIYFGGVRMKPTAVGAMQRAVFAKFPTVTVVNIADALAIVQQVVDQIALVIRFLSAFAILAGAIILAASVAGTRFRRIREVAILKTLGGTRKHVRRIFSIEFLTLGAVAGLMGGLLAAGFSSLLLNRLLDSSFQADWKPIATAVALTALLANLSGWLASLRIMGQKPLEVLRSE
jgi:putative ABC transport system permease protein